MWHRKRKMKTVIFKGSNSYYLLCVFQMVLTGFNQSINRKSHSLLKRFINKLSLVMTSEKRMVLTCYFEISIRIRLIIIIIYKETYMALQHRYYLK